MSNKFSLNDINKTKNRTIFFDTNILIYLFWSASKSHKHLQDTYAEIYSELIKRNNTVSVNFIVISEFLNRLLRIKHSEYLALNNLDKTDFNFKNYRDSDTGYQDFDEVASLIEDLILDKFNITEDSFSKHDIKNFLEHYSLDFSDNAILKTCKLNNFVLLTHDYDFYDSNVDILTANHKMFH